MPRRCCICGATKSVKYNEVPSDPTQREKWLAVIPNRDNLGENPVVCNRHFQPADYEPNFKVRRLKRGVIPMVIPHKEMDFEPYKEEGQRERYLDFFGTQIKEKNSELIEAKAKLQKIEVSMRTITNSGGSVDKQLETVMIQLDHLKEENKKKALKIQSLQSEVKELKATCQSQETEIKSKDKLIEQCNEKVKHLESLIKVPCQEQTAKSNIKTYFQAGGKKKDLESVEKERHLEIARMKVKNAKDRGVYVERIQKLKMQVDVLVSERRDLEQNTYYKNLENLILNMDADRKAGFLLDQIKVYNKKAPRYSDVTLQECIIWEDTDPNGYQYVRDSELLTLPAQWTMKKHLGPMDIDKEDTSISICTRPSSAEPAGSREKEKSDFSSVVNASSCGHNISVTIFQ